MKKTYLILYLAVLLLFLFFSMVRSEKARDPYGKLDVVSVVVDQKPNSDKVVAKVNLLNDEKLTAIIVPLVYGTGKTPITLDSVSFVNTRVEKFVFKYPNIDKKNQKVNIALISSLSGANVYLSKGEGEITRLYFTLKEGAKETSVTLDTTFFPPSNILQMVEAEVPEVKSILPGFDNSKGKIMLLK